MNEQHRDPEAEVRRMLDEGYPQSWKWDEDGPEVIGYALRKELGQTENGPCEILVLNVKNSEGAREPRSVWLMHTALLSKLQRMRPRTGDLVGIRQLGKRQPQSGGREYMDYNVVVYGAKGNSLEWSPAEALPAGVVDAEVVEEAGPEPVQQQRVPAAQHSQGGTGGGSIGSGWDDGGF